MDKKFLLRVWNMQEPNEGNYFFLTTLHAKTKEWKEHFFEWPITDKQLSKFEKEYSGEKYNVYFCATPFQRPQRKKSFVIGSRFLWADLDETKPRDCEIVPQIAWKSSDERYAALWTLDKFYDAPTIEQRNKALSYNIGADKGGWDLTQVLRVPGTINHKYTPIARVRTLWFKTTQYNLKKFPESVYKNLDPQGVLHEYKNKIRPSTLRLLTAKRASEGKRSEVIWKINNDMAEQGFNAQIRFNLLKGSVWNKFAGRHDEEVQLMREVEKVESRKILTLEEDKDEEKKITRMSDVEAEDVKWLWFPYIPIGKVTLLEGDPGLGKSWFTMALAAFISSKTRLPRCTEAPQGKVLLLSAEDGLADTIRPRLDMLGADAKRVYAYNTSVYLDEDGFAEIEKYVEELRPSLVIIDPIVAYMGGGVDLFRANETREIMNGLAQIAERQQCAIIAVRHLTKGGKDKAIYRGSGSIDITAAARSVLMVGQHPDESHIRCICHIKHNLSQKGDTIEYSLDAGRTNPFRFEGFSYITPEQILKADSNNDNTKVKDEAEKFLSETLQKRSVDQDMLFRDAEAAGISRKILKQAAEKLEIRKIKSKGKVKWLFT